DTLVGGFSGRYDNVVFRIMAFPGRSGPHSAAGPYQRPYVSATTFPFRMRGLQTRVVRPEKPNGEAGALVYWLPKGQTRNAQLLTFPNRSIARTDPLGYLASREPIVPGDRLVALLPISATDTYSMYFTSAMPVSTGIGLDMHAVSASGVQTLTVAPSRP